MPLFHCTPPPIKFVSRNIYHLHAYKVTSNRLSIIEVGMLLKIFANRTSWKGTMATIFHIFLAAVSMPLILCAPNISSYHRILKWEGSSVERYAQFKFHKMNILNSVNKLYRKKTRSKRETVGLCNPVHYDMKTLMVYPCNEIEWFHSNADDYPTNEISEALSKTRTIFDDYFSVINEFNITTRMKNIKTVENVCDFDEQIIFPKKFGKPGENGPYIVNTKDKQQGIRVQKCREEEGSCKIPGSLPNGYKSKCIQKYSMKSLVVYYPIEQSIKIHKYKVPSCCTCLMINDE